MGDVSPTTIRTEFACGLPQGHAEGIRRDCPGVQVLAAERGFHLLEFGVILPSRHGQELKARTGPARGPAAQVLLASRTANVHAAGRVLVDHEVKLEPSAAAGDESVRVVNAAAEGHQVYL